MDVDFLRCKRNDIFRTCHDAELATLASVAVDDYSSFYFCHDNSIYRLFRESKIIKKRQKYICRISVAFSRRSLIKLVNDKHQA